VLPLQTELDYKTSTTSPTVGTLADSKAEYRRPFAVAYLPDQNRYCFLDKISSRLAAVLAPKAGGFAFSCSVRMHDDHCAVILDVSGANQHVLAKSDYTASEAAGVAALSWPACIDWKKIYVTVFVEFDQFAEAKWPETSLSTDADQVRRLVIDCPKMRLDYLAPSTIIDVDEAGQAVTTAGGYVRDNRDRLKDIARGAYEWYGRKRQTIEYVRKNLVSDVQVGTLITKVGSENDPQEVNTVVTQMTYDLRAGTVAVKTQFGELDIKSRYV
jgi:hypothetical protein